MMRFVLLIMVVLALLSCRKEVEAPVPDTRWDLFESINAVPVDAGTQGRMAGVFAVSEGADMFGGEVVLKWSWTRTGSDTAYHVSIFSGKDIAFLTGSGKYLDSTMLLNMYWRTMINTGTGLCRLTMAYEEGVQQLWSGDPPAPGGLVIRGVYGSGDDVPDRAITLTWQRPLNTSHHFHALGHRGGGRNADLPPASENSVELIRMAARLGCTGVEIDVRLTSDGVPVIYHDNNLNTRCVQPCGLFGPIEDYSYAQLSTMVRLINGERIPTLREALDAVVYNTPLEQVWLDTKYAGSMEVVRGIQAEYLAAAAATGRDVRILIGLPTEDQLSSFLQLSDHQSVPSLCELEISDVQSAGSEVWGPRWTLGLQLDKVAQMHGEGRKVYVWTLDAPDYVREFMYDGDFDGILSNYPMLVTFYDHVRP